MSVAAEPWVVVLVARNTRQIDEAGFVLRAIGIEHVATQLDGAWQLSVPSGSATRASEELAAYRAEVSAAAKSHPVHLDEPGAGWPGVATYAAALLCIAVAVNQDAFGWNWLGMGRLDVDRVLAGEWWRTVTALCLHADTVHLAGNIAFGGFFGVYAGRYVGDGLAWLGIVLGGVLGNALNAVIQPSGHLAIGASTAVFAALGLLAAYIGRRGAYRHTSWRARAAPITAALGLLAFTGTGGGVPGGSVDIVAHLTGFIAGIVIGVLLASGYLPQTRRVQAYAATSTVAIVAGAWLWAWLAT